MLHALFIRETRLWCSRVCANWITREAGEFNLDSHFHAPTFLILIMPSRNDLFLIESTGGQVAPTFVFRPSDAKGIPRPARLLN